MRVSYCKELIVSMENVSAYKPLWLNRGGMAEKWWACLDLNQGLLAPILEEIIPGYADAMLQALEENDMDDLVRIIELLKAVGSSQ